MSQAVPTREHGRLLCLLEWDSLCPGQSLDRCSWNSSDTRQWGTEVGVSQASASRVSLVRGGGGALVHAGGRLPSPASALHPLGSWRDTCPIPADLPCATSLCLLCGDQVLTFPVSLFRCACARKLHHREWKVLPADVASVIRSQVRKEQKHTD